MAFMQPKSVLASDTSLEAERVQVESWRRMAPSEKLRAVAEATNAVLQLSLAGIRLRYPEASDEECKLRLAILTLGRPLACQVYPEAARLRGR